MEHWKITEHLDAAVTAMRQATIGDYNERLEKITSAIRHVQEAKAEIARVESRQAAGNGTLADVVILLKQIERNTAPRSYNIDPATGRITQHRSKLCD